MTRRVYLFVVVDRRKVFCLVEATLFIICDQGGETCYLSGERVASIRHKILPIAFLQSGIASDRTTFGC